MSRRQYVRRSASASVSRKDGSRKSRKYSRRGSRKAKDARHRPSTAWSRFVKAHFKAVYERYRGSRQRVTRAEHREFFSRTMKDLKRDFPAGERKERRVKGGSRKRYSRKPYGSRGKYHMKGGSRKIYSRKPYGSRGKYHMKGGSRKIYSRKPYGSRGQYRKNPNASRRNTYPRRVSRLGAEVDAGALGVRAGVSNRGREYPRRKSRLGAEVDVGALNVSAGVGNRLRGPVGRRRSSSASVSRGTSRAESRAQSSTQSRAQSRAVSRVVDAPASLLGGVAALVTAPIRALVGSSARPLTKREKEKARREKDAARRAAKKGAPGALSLPRIPVLPPVGAEVGVRTRGRAAAAGIQTRGKGKGKGKGAANRRR